MDDIFGDDADAEIQTPRAEDSVSEENLVDNDDLFGDNAENDEMDEEAQDTKSVQSLEPEVVTNFSVANYRQPRGDSEALYLAKLPSYLDVNSFPYDAESLLAEIQQFAEVSNDADDKMTKKRSLINTLRWRYEQSGSQTVRQSNARFVKWSDGSMSLQVGEELFDVPMKEINKEHNYLTLMHADEGLLRTMKRFSHSLSFQPYGISSKSHAELKADIARRVITSKSRSVKLHTDMIDPAELQKQAIKMDNEKQKARRRLDNQKARAMNYSSGRDRTQLTARYLDDSDEEMAVSNQRYADDNDDGFIVDDEDDAAAARLQALKDASSADYRDRKSKRQRGNSDEEEESEDESIIYENDAGEVSEEEAVMTPKQSPEPRRESPSTLPRSGKLKRRIADSDDDDE